MSDTLRDQLLNLGFKPAPPPVRQVGRTPERQMDGRRDGRPKDGGGDPTRHAKRNGPPRGARPPGAQLPASKRRDGNAAPGRQRSREEIDLAKAYAIRAQKEKEERIAAEAARQEEARKRREARARLADFLKDKALNDKDADIARHFPYGGKIKRVYVNAEQLRALNAGELGVAQLDGRYLLVTASVLDEAEAIFAPAVALRVDPHATPEEDPYADPRYQVPDDLVW